MPMDVPKRGDLRAAPPAVHAVVVDVAELPFLMVDGHGSPTSGPDFQQAIDALYAVAHSLQDPTVEPQNPPLEALWWWDEKTPPYPPNEREWRWTLMLRIPRVVGKDMLEAAKTRARTGMALPALDKVRAERFREGRCMEMLHVGPYSREIQTIGRLHEDLRRAGFVPAGKHHEIYLTDPRDADPEAIRTLLRQPVRWMDEEQA